MDNNSILKAARNKWPDIPLLGDRNTLSSPPPGVTGETGPGEESKEKNRLTLYAAGPQTR